MRTLLSIVLFSVFTAGCSSERTVYTISVSSQLQAPFKASKFFGFFDKNELDLQLDSVPNGNSLVRFLNFSKYSVVLIDSKTAKKIESLSPRWKQICTIALKKTRKSTISKPTKFVLLMKDSLLSRQKEAVKVIEGWNYGVDLLKDPAVMRLLSLKGNPYKFLYCGK